jgi:hypothetical protein
MSSNMTVIIAGTPRAAPTLAATLETAAETDVWAREPEPDADSVAGLAEALVACEAEMAGRQVDSIVLADDSDAALAAALVGTKLPVEVLAVAGAREARTPNGRLIAQLAAAYTPPA